MSLTCSMLIAITLSTGPVGVEDRPVPRETAVEAAGAIARAAQAPTAGRVATADAWSLDRIENRPRVLPLMYATLGAFNALDVYSTRRAIRAGAYEANPAMRKAAASAATMVAVKALSMAGTIYFTERAWKANRKGAIVMMAIVNGATAAIAARNLRNARR